MMYSGGMGSWSAAKRVAEKYGTSDLILLFTDTKMEDEDLYRFLHEGHEAIGGELVIIADGRTPWEIFHDTRMLGNSLHDPCSRILKRELSRRWVKEHCDVNDTTLYIGIDWTEEHRFRTAKKAWLPWKLEAPLCAPPYLVKQDVTTQLEKLGIEIPRLYKMGFSHNNCGGFCVKAGQAHFKLLLETMPDRYKYHEQKELEMREYLGRDDISILRIQRNKKKHKVTLRDFRCMVERGEKVDLDEWGGCGCFLDGDEDLERREGESP